MNKTPWFLVSIFVVVLDQMSKYWIEHTLTPYESISILPGLSFTLAFNTGAAFSFLSGAGDWHKWFFSCFSLGISFFLIVWILRTSSRAYWLLSGLGMILGGALGNLVDRVTAGHVIDFIDVYYKHYHWPIFNIADSAICLGAALLFIDLFKNPKDNK